MMLALVAIWAFAEASLFFLVADVPISWIGLRRGSKSAVIAALVAAPMAALGGLGLRWATLASPAMVHDALVHVPGISEGLLVGATRDWQAKGGLAMLTGSFAGVPYKLYAHAAALGHLPAAALLVLSVVARLPRFVAVALLSGAMGNRLRRTRPAKTLAFLHLGFWLLFYAIYFTAMAT